MASLLWVRRAITYIFLDNGGRSKGADGHAQNRVDVAAKEERHAGNGDTGNRRPGKLAAERIDAGMAPGHEGANAHEQYQDDKERAIHFVKEGRGHSNAIPGQNFAKHGEGSAPEGGKGDAGKEPVIGEKGRFPARIGLKLMLIT